MAAVVHAGVVHSLVGNAAILLYVLVALMVMCYLVVVAANPVLVSTTPLPSIPR
jgi:hypothetical protein